MRLVILLLMVAALSWRCGGGAAPTTAAAPQATKSGSGTPPIEKFLLEGDYAASHLLVAYQGAQAAGLEVTRNKAEAKAKASALLEKLKAHPSSFESLAREESDGASKTSNGALGSWKKGQMPAVIEAALEQLAVGAICDKVVESEFGFHLLRRDSRYVKHYAGYAFFIAFKGNPQNPPTVRRERGEALALAEKLAAQANANTFMQLAKENGDLTEGAQFLGGLPENTTTSPQLLERLKTLNFQEVSRPVEVPGAFALLMRTALEQLAGSHILIVYQGAKNAPPSVTRKAEEAEARAKALILQLKANPEDFATLAKNESDSSAGSVGGELGVWFKGAMISGVDEVIAGLKVGEISSVPLKTEYGYHILRRNPLPPVPSEEQ